jgi:hypothetical protein
MRIIKFLEYIKEGLDTPESLVKTRLKEIKNKLDSFLKGDSSANEVEVPDEDIVRKPEELEKIKGDKLTLRELGIELESSEIFNYSSLTIKFSDDQYTYTLIIIIDLKEAANNINNKEEGDEEKSKDKTPEDIENCSIKFKKYSLDKLSEILGQLPTKTVKIDDIDEDFLIDLKIELDEKWGDEAEGLGIETE